MPLGNLLLGAVAEKTGALFSVSFFAAVTLLITIIINWKAPELRRLR